MPVVRIPTVLRKHTGGHAKVEGDGRTVGEVLRAVVAQHPDLEEQIFDDGAVRGFINVYVDDEDIRYVDGLDSPVESDSEVAIMPAVAGGSRQLPMPVLLAATAPTQPARGRAPRRPTPWQTHDALR